MPLYLMTDPASMVDHSKYWLQLLKDSQSNLGIVDVYYGDQSRIPRTPTVCVEPGEKRNALHGAPRRVEVTIETYVLVYHNAVSSTQTIREEDDALAEAIENLIHGQPYMKNAAGDDQAVDSLVTRIESGFQQRSAALLRASRLTVESRVLTQLPSAF